MKRTPTLSIRDIINTWVSAKGITPKLTESRARQAWLTRFEKFAPYTGDVWLRDDILYIRITSSVARQELLLRRRSIIVALDEELGGHGPKDIIFR